MDHPSFSKATLSTLELLHHFQQVLTLHLGPMLLEEKELSIGKLKPGFGFPRNTGGGTLKHLGCRTPFSGLLGFNGFVNGVIAPIYIPI